MTFWRVINTLSGSLRKMFRKILPILALCVVLLGCGSRNSGNRVGRIFPQEPITDVRFTSAGNPVLFGLSVEPQYHALVLSKIESVTRARLPGVQFEIYAYPLHVTGGPHSFRAPTLNLIVLSWWLDTQGHWTFGDTEWEVEHLVAKTDDQGNPWPR